MEVNISVYLTHLKTRAKNCFAIFAKRRQLTNHLVNFLAYFCLFLCKPKADSANAMLTLRKFIENYVSLPDDEWTIISQAFERNEFRKNEFLLEEGSVCRYFYFIESGLVRFFLLNNDGDEVTKFFTTAPYCFTAKDSFRNQTPARESIQALDRTIVWQTTLQQSNDLLALKSWSDFTRKFVHEVQSYTEELLMESKTETAEIRYRKLQEKYPELIQKIPLKHLSSFLGIAPQSLSRIRKKS